MNLFDFDSECKCCFPDLDCVDPGRVWDYFPAVQHGFSYSESNIINIKHFGYRENQIGKEMDSLSLPPLMESVLLLTVIGLQQ